MARNSSTSTTIVGCKLPHGLVLQLRGDDNTVIAEKTLRKTMIDVKPYVRENAVSFTEVDTEFWTAWADWATKNKFKPFTEGFIFAQDTLVNAKAEGREKAKERQGQERLDPKDKTDPRMGEFRAAGLKKFTTKDKEEE